MFQQRLQYPESIATENPWRSGEDCVACSHLVGLGHRCSLGASQEPTECGRAIFVPQNFPFRAGLPKSLTRALGIANSTIRSKPRWRGSEHKRILSFPALILSLPLLNITGPLHQIDIVYATSSLHFISNAAGPTLWRGERGYLAA